VTKVAAIAGEIKNPGTNLPRAMILSLFIMTLIYVSIAFVLVGNLPLNELQSDIKPIYTISKLLGGDIIGYAACIYGNDVHLGKRLCHSTQRNIGTMVQPTL